MDIALVGFDQSTVPTTLLVVTVDGEFGPTLDILFHKIPNVKLFTIRDNPPIIGCNFLTIFNG